ncbi:MAG TPA: hypothetical protein DCK76_00550 [Desulfotomaculum sp.]|nr:hypothetical protein [Desulfotomaculum sp.]HBY04616.1 hypothetical protein [Desulfotomaculum sp.]
MKKIMVIGAGQMGGGIAQVAAQAGFDVIVNDLTAELLEKGLSVIAKNLDRNVKKGKMKEEEAQAVLKRLRPSISFEDAASFTIAANHTGPLFFITARNKGKRLKNLKRHLLKAAGSMVQSQQISFPQLISTRLKNGTRTTI